MTTATITATFSGCNPPARKTILLNRCALLSAWPRYFPQHSFSDLRLISSNPADSYWNGDDWKRAARSYHDDRRRGRL